MIFVWSYLTNGDAVYILVQVAVNDLIILFAFATIAALLLGIGGASVPILCCYLFFSLWLFH